MLLLLRKILVHMQDAVADRLTVVLHSGEAVRVALPFAPAEPLPRLALEALAQVLPAGLYHSIASKQLMSPGLPSFQHLPFSLSFHPGINLA